jgi:hypothetical protein
MELIDSLRRLRHTMKYRQAVTFDEPVPYLVGTFPSDAVCNELIHAYFRTFEVMYRIIHVPNFWTEYKAYQQSPFASSIAFRMKLALILAIGTTFYPRRADLEHLHRLVQVWTFAAQHYLTGPTEKAANNLEGVQIACLLLLTRQVTKVGMTNSLCSDVALRLAMTAGMHRDPDRFPALSPFMAQMRRRLWYSAVELTLQSLFNLAMPMTVGTADYDTKPPLDINDEEMRLDSKTAPASAPPGTVTDHSLQRALLISLPMRLKIAAMLNGLHEAVDFEEAIYMAKQLKVACQGLAKFISAATDQRDGNALQISSFHARFLDMGLRRYMLMLHRPFVLQARCDPRFHYARKVCLESAMIIASYSQSMRLPAEPSDDMSRFLTTVKGPTNGALSLDVITMLGLELLTQLEEEQGSDDNPPDAAQSLARAARAPIFQVLEHICEQLVQIISLGSASLKRYGYVSTMLSQLRAMENGNDVLQAVFSSLLAGGRTKRPALEAAIAASRPKDTVASLTTREAVVEPTPPEFDFEAFSASELDIGFPEFFHFPEMTEGGMMEW